MKGVLIGLLVAAAAGAVAIVIVRRRGRVRDVETITNVGAGHF